MEPHYVARPWFDVERIQIRPPTESGEGLGDFADRDELAVGKIDNAADQSVAIGGPRYSPNEVSDEREIASLLASTKNYWWKVIEKTDYETGDHLGKVALLVFARAIGVERPNNHHRQLISLMISLSI
jgi:hypothetical protein